MWPVSSARTAAFAYCLLRVSMPVRRLVSLSINVTMRAEQRALARVRSNLGWCQASALTFTELTIKSTDNPELLFQQNLERLCPRMMLSCFLKSILQLIYSISLSFGWCTWILCTLIDHKRSVFQSWQLCIYTYWTWVHCRGMYRFLHSAWLLFYV